MASNSSSLFDVFYMNNNRGLEGSIPNMDSTRVNQQYDSSVFNAAPYASPPYIPNQQNFSGLIPFPNDLPSQMGVEHPFSVLNMASSSSSSLHSSPFVTNYNNFNHELMPLPNDLPFQMGVKQYFSPLNMASSSSSYSSCVTNYNNINELMPFPNEMASEMGFMGTTVVQNEFENFNGLMPFPNEMPFEMGFSQTTSGLNDPLGLRPFPNDMPSRMCVDQTLEEQYSVHTTGLNELEGITTGFDALVPIPNDITSISGMVDIPQIMGDDDFNIDMDLMDLEFMTKWLEQEEELNQKLTNDGALAISRSQSSNVLTRENTNFDSTNNGVHATLSGSFSRSTGVPHTSHNEAKPFGKRGLLLFQAPTNKPWESRRRRTSTTVQISDAIFHIPEGLTNSIPMDDEHRKAGPQLDVHRSNTKAMKVKPLLLAERRKGWKIETRMRVNGFVEKFYYHEMSRLVFRSTTEVENFILNEVYPVKPKRNMSNKRNS